MIPMNESPRCGKSRGVGILMLANEYPPAAVGGLGRAVCDLARALAKQGYSVHVVTGNAHGQPGDSVDQGVRVHRARPCFNGGMGLLEGNLALNIALAEKALDVIGEFGIGVVHAHDWLVARAAKAVKELSGLPLAATVHATEHGRNNGIRTPLQAGIHSLEWELTFQAAVVVVCSGHMAGEVGRLFSLPSDKIRVIPNGVGLPQGPKPDDARDSAIRAAYALPWEKVVFLIGRMVWEKGVDTLLDSVPRILSACPDAKFVIAGTGPMLRDFRDKAGRMGLGDKAYFPGYMPDCDRDALFRTCGTAVFPSLYEPFGIVALEAMSMGAPVVVSGTGGLGDLVNPGVDGLRVPPGDSGALADAIIRMLDKPGDARAMALRAAEKVRREYGWGPIALKTVEAYESIMPIEREVVAI